MARRASIAALLVLFAFDAGAVDGVIEINQASASAGGVTPGDGPGFPVTLSQSGSYRLTGDLSTGVRSTSLIQITADRVTLDLGGFSLVYCARGLCGVGDANAIDADFDTADVTVRNGNVYNAGGACVRVDAVRARVEGVRAVSCGGFGIIVGERSVIEASVSDQSASGFLVRQYGRISRSGVFRTTGPSTVLAELGSLIESTTVSDNAGYALREGFNQASNSPATYRDCVLQDNGGGEVQIPADEQLWFRSGGGNTCGGDGVCP